MAIAQQQQLPFLHSRTTPNWTSTRSLRSAQTAAAPRQPVVHFTSRCIEQTSTRAAVVATVSEGAQVVRRLGATFAAARFAHALELCGACMLIATFVGVALFG